MVSAAFSRVSLIKYVYLRLFWTVLNKVERVPVRLRLSLHVIWYLIYFKNNMCIFPATCVYSLNTLTSAIYVRVHISYRFIAYLYIVSYHIVSPLN